MRRTPVIPVLFLSVLSYAGTALAQVHKCTVSGKTVYQQEVCSAGAEKGERVRILSDGSTQSRSMPWDGAPEVKAEILPLSGDEAASAFSSNRPGIVNGLKDPDSARFEGVKVLRVRHAEEDATYTCGTVNAKNSYGGYAGSELFFSDGFKTGITSGRFERAKKIGGHCVMVQFPRTPR